MRKIKFITIGILILLMLLIAFQNREPVETKILMMTIIMPRAALLCLTTFIGFISGALTMYLLRKKES